MKSLNKQKAECPTTGRARYLDRQQKLGAKYLAMEVDISAIPAASPAMAELQSTATAELQNTATAELQSTATAELQNTATAELQNLSLIHI